MRGGRLIGWELHATPCITSGMKPSPDSTLSMRCMRPILLGRQTGMGMFCPDPEDSRVELPAVLDFRSKYSDARQDGLRLLPASRQRTLLSSIWLGVGEGRMEGGTELLGPLTMCAVGSSSSGACSQELRGCPLTIIGRLMLEGQTGSSRLI